MLKPEPGMGKRKKSSRKPGPTRRKEPLGAFQCLSVTTRNSSAADNAFTCLFCHHDKSVTVRLDRKEGIAQLVCRVCDQRYQSKVNRACIYCYVTFDIIMYCGQI